jgi:hypothetical protein
MKSGEQSEFLYVLAFLWESGGELSHLEGRETTQKKTSAVGELSDWCPTYSSRFWALGAKRYHEGCDKGLALYRQTQYRLLLPLSHRSILVIRYTAYLSPDPLDQRKRFSPKLPIYIGIKGKN